MIPRRRFSLGLFLFAVVLMQGSLASGQSVTGDGIEFRSRPGAMPGLAPPIRTEDVYGERHGRSASLRRERVTEEDIIRWNSLRAPTARLTDFERSGSVRWPERLRQSPLARDAARFDAISAACWTDGEVAPHQAVAVLDRMLLTLKADLHNWRPMEYAQAKSQLIRLRNWSLRGFE
jgi:hypothetical protein